MTRITSRTRLFSLALFGVLTNSFCSLALDENAFVSLKVGTVFPYQFDQIATGIQSASLEDIGSTPEGASWSGLAEVGVGQSGDIEGVLLRGQVKGTAPSDKENYAPWRTGGRAVASFYDEIAISGLVDSEQIERFEDINQEEEDPTKPLSHKTYVLVTFQPLINGDLTGNTTARFLFQTTSFDFVTLELTNVGRQVVLSSWIPEEFPLNGPEGFSRLETGQFPVAAFVPVNAEYLEDEDKYLISGVTSFFMSLEVTATGYPGGASSEASFQHTAGLGPIAINGIDGTPGPVIQNLRLTGLSGIQYAAAVPEPNSMVLSLSALAVVAPFVWARRRTFTS